MAMDWATEPSKKRENAPWPCDPNTIRSTSKSVAFSKIAFLGNPSTILVVIDNLPFFCFNDFAALLTMVSADFFAFGEEIKRST